jgi:hypothetical protein
LDSRDELYSLQGTLNSLALLKIAYDAGVPMNIFNSYEVSIDFGVDPSWENLHTSLEYLFDIVEYISPHDEDKDSVENKKYWMNLAKRDFYDETGIFVILDDRLQHFNSFSIGDYFQGGWYSGYGEVVPIEKGILVTCNEEEGTMDNTDILAAVVRVLEDSERCVTNEMAV